MNLRIVLGGVLTVLCSAALLRSDFGFYNPVLGVAAAGREVNDEKHSRELLRLTLTAGDLRRLGTPATLGRLSTFYGADDSLKCSLRMSFGRADSALASRPLSPGQVVTLCLN